METPAITLLQGLTINVTPQRRDPNGKMIYAVVALHNGQECGREMATTAELPSAVTRLAMGPLAVMGGLVEHAQGVASAGRSITGVVDGLRGLLRGVSR